MNVLKNTHPQVYAVDKSLHKLLKDIELLAYLNPNNIEQEKKRFLLLNIPSNLFLRTQNLSLMPINYNENYFLTD